MINVLYIDDEKFDQIAFKRLVSQFHQTGVKLASNKNEALKILENNTIDIIVSDVYLGQEIVDWTDFEAEVFYVSGLEQSFSKLSKSFNKTERCFVKPLKKLEINRILNIVKSYTPQYDIIHEIAEGDLDFEIEMKQIFINEIPDQMLRAEKAFLEGDNKEVANLVHAMQSKIRTFGLKKIEIIAEKIENHSRAGHKLSEIKDDLEELKSLLKKSLRVIKRDLR